MANKKDSVPAWPKQPLLARVGACRAMLHIYGFLSDAENKKVHARIMREFTKRSGKGKSGSEQ